MVRVKLLTISTISFFLGACVMVGYRVYDIEKNKSKTLVEPSTRPPIQQADEGQRQSKDLNNVKPTEREQEPSTTLPNCRSRKEFSAAKNGTDVDPKVWDKVKLMVLFVGYERSGHSLVSALLDAHPNMVIADERHALNTWQRFPKAAKTRNNLFQTLYTNTVQVAKRGERSSDNCKSTLGGYKYKVPHQWQGRFDRFIQVIGDKQGPQTIRTLEYQPNNKYLFPQMKEAVNVPVKFIHVVRNPFDIVGRIVYIRGYRGKKEDLKGPFNASVKLQIDIATDHARLSRGVVKLIKRNSDDVITIYSEDMIKKPIKELERLCHFLSVTCSKDYLKDCSSIVKKTQSKSRYKILWNDEARNILNELIQKTPLLKRYKFDED